MKQRFPCLNWHCHKVAFYTGDLADVESFLLSLWHFCGFSSCNPAGPPGSNSYDSGRALFSKYCWLISPPASPYFFSGSISANYCCWSPSAFSRWSSWEGHKVAQGQLSLSGVVYIWSMGEIPTIGASFSWLDVNEMSAAPSEGG